MGTLVSKEDFLNVAKTVQGAGSVAEPNLGQEIAGFHSTMKEFQGMLGTVDGIIKNIMKLKGIQEGQQGGLQGSPSQIQSSKPNPQIPPPTSQEEKIIPQQQITTSEERKEVPKLDSQRVYALLYDLIVVQAEKLPQEVKDKQLKEITGENFKTYTFMYKGIIPVGHDQILATITEQVVEAIHKIQNE